VTRRLTLALPSKGRLREPSWTLLEASGVAPQEPGDRVLQAHCRNADIDLLFVRADDVPEYVQDSVVDCGITGLDLLAERDCNVEVLLRLGFGSCSLQAAVSMEDSATTIEDLEGRRIATSHPRIAARVLADRGVKADLVQVAGSVEISPRLGLADAIIDLVSTGSTLRTNGLRSIGVLFESEAVLIGRAGSTDLEARRTLTTLLGSVINARANR
jgi:ATP phosphoribosyltransferase